MVAMSNLRRNHHRRQTEAATQLNVTQQGISDLMRGNINRFSLDSLKEMARSLG